MERETKSEAFYFFVFVLELFSKTKIKSKSGFLGFMIRAFLWGTDPKIAHLSSGLPCKFTGLAIFSLDLA